MTRAAGARARAIAITLVTALGASALPGCALLSAAKVDPPSYMLNPVVPDMPQARHCTATTLLVFPPQAQASYDTTQMAYTTRADQISYFARHEWADTPSRMLLPLLVKALQNTRCFNAVVAPPYTAHYTLALRTDLVELLQDFTSQPPTLRLVLRDPAGQERTANIAAQIIEHHAGMTFLGSGDLPNAIRNMDLVGMSGPRVVEVGDELMILKFPYFYFDERKIDALIGKARKHKALILDLRGNRGGSEETLK